MLLGSKYLFKKQTATQFVTAAQSIIQKGIEEETAETTRKIGSLRAGMWFLTVAIIVLLVITFAVIFRSLIGPLNDFVKRLNRDEELDDTTGLREVRRVASEYNEVLFRRNALDEILRSAAERDSLTGLQNRYAFESAVIGSESEERPIGIALFDVNYLKRTNDTLGHTAGDELLRNAAYCIRKCFSQGDGNNLFRYGGDEFAAIMKDISEEDMEALMKKFRLVQQERGISVSAGYAFAQSAAGVDLKEMIGLADDRMYDQKQLDHAEARANGLA
jgi:diguanylate cyclase (GGDEF)-like protein